MRVLVVHCPPVETGFHAALRQEVPKNLRAARHEAGDRDLHAGGFNPVLSRKKRLGCHDVSTHQLPLQPYVERLQGAEGYHAHCHMNVATERQLTRFMARFA
jgi:putative NADPH-quinone reductase